MTVLSVLGVAAYLVGTQVYPDFATSLRYAAFNVVSIATTTGYANADFGHWPIFRAVVDAVPVQLRELLGLDRRRYKDDPRPDAVQADLPGAAAHHPSRVANPVKLSGQPVENNVVFAVLAYVFVYVICIVAFTLLLAVSGADVVTAFSAAVVSLNNTGPGLGAVGPGSTYAVLNDFQIWMCSFAMLLGRLELFTLLVVLTPAFWQR